MSTPTNARGPLVFILANTTGVSTALRAGQVFRFVGVLMAAIAALWPTEPSIAVWMLAGAAMTIGLTDVIIDTASVTASAFIVSEEDYEKTYARLFFFNRAGSVVLGLDARRRIGGRRGRRNRRDPAAPLCRRRSRDPGVRPRDRTRPTRATPGNSLGPASARCDVSLGEPGQRPHQGHSPRTRGENQNRTTPRCRRSRNQVRCSARAPHNVPHATTCGSAVARMLFRISMMS